MQYAFYLLGPFAFLGSADFRGWWIVAVLRALVRLLFVFGMAFVCTWALVRGDAFSPPDPAEVARQVCLVVESDRATCPAAAESKAPDYVTAWVGGLEPRGLHDKVVTGAVKKVDNTIDVTKASFSVEIRTGTAWRPLPAKPTDAERAAEYRLTARIETDTGTRLVPLFIVERALVEIASPGDLWSDTAFHDLWTGAFGGSWPFRSITFDASPYVLSSLVLGQADPDLSAGDKDRAKEIMDAYLDSVPAAASDGFVLPRRLNGPVQYACYLLFFAGLIFIALHWIVNILPNRLLRATSVFTVRSDRFPDTAPMPQPKASAAMPEQAAEDVERGSEDDVRPALRYPPPDGTPGNVDVAAPWSRRTTDLDMTIREMEAIRDVVRRRSGFLAFGAVPAFPKLDVWIAGLLAMKSSRSGENVPSFVSTEIEAAAERLEAHQRLLAFIVWAIPTLGFIGTVLGIGTALLATVDLQSGESITRLQAESRVAVEIGVAFDTTLIALALSFVLMLALHVMQHLEESMLSEEKHDALRALVQIENILPDDPIRELRDGLTQMGLSAAQIERWSDILGGQAPRFKEVMDRAEREYAEWSSEYRRRRTTGAPVSLVVAGLVVITLLGIYAFDPTLFGLLD